MNMLELFKSLFSASARRERVVVTPRSAKRARNVFHILEFLAPTKNARRFHGTSAYKSFKPMNAPRHISGK